jgi:Flp pilus assembly pilin Flp
MEMSSSELGQGFLEYAFVVVFISVAFIVVCQVLGIKVIDLFEYATVLLREVFAWLI